MAGDDVGERSAKIRARLVEIARTLEALSSPTRLELLHELRRPRALHDIHVVPSKSRLDERPDRPLSRQGVSRHLDFLLDAELVRRIAGDGGREGDLYLLNHERVFAIVDELRDLTKLRPVADWGGDGTVTSEGEGRDAEPELPVGPRLLVAYGRDDGAAFPLAGPVGARWRIGRAPACEIRLDYDPFLSGVHATIDREEVGFVVRDGGSRNGTSVNFARLAFGKARALAPGDLLVVGRSVLAFQP